MNKILNFQSELIEKISLTESIFKLIYTIPEEFVFTPGQFVGIRPIPTHTRAYSIVGQSVINGKKTLELLVDIRPGGIASRFFEKTNVGESTHMLGPFGVYGVKNKIKNKVFISTGTGVAPFIPMIKDLKNEDKGKINFLFGAQIESHDIAYDYFKDYIGEDFSYYLCVTREAPSKSYSYSGRVTKVLTELIEGKIINVNDFEFYICGANDMIHDVVEVLKVYNTKNIFFEKYG